LAAAWKQIWGSLNDLEFTDRLERTTPWLLKHEGRKKKLFKKRGKSKSRPMLIEKALLVL